MQICLHFIWNTDCFDLACIPRKWIFFTIYRGIWTRCKQSNKKYKTNAKHQRIDARSAVAHLICSQMAICAKYSEIFCANPQ